MGLICFDNVKNEKTEVRHPYGITADDVRIINIEGHTSVDVQCFVFVNEFKKFSEVRKIVMEYQNEKFKRRKILIKKARYGRIIKAHEEESK